MKWINSLVLVIALVAFGDAQHAHFPSHKLHPVSEKSARDLTLPAGSVFSATCREVDTETGDVSFRPYYGRVVASPSVSDRSVSVQAENVQFRELFKSLKAKVSASASDKRSLRGSSSSGDLGLPGVEFDHSSNVQSSSDLSSADVDFDRQILQGFGFNYNPATGQAVDDSITIEGQEWAKCSNCFAYVDDARVHVEMDFNDFGAPQKVAAWVEGGMGANVEVEVTNPRVATQGDGIVRIAERQQVFVFEFALGPIPVRWHVYGELLAKVVLENPIPEGALAARGGVYADVDLKSGVQWTNNNGWAQIDENTVSYGMYPAAVITPDLSQRNSLSATLIPTVEISLYDAVPFIIRPMPTIGYEFGGDVNGCANQDGYAQFSKFELGVGVGDIKVPANGPTIIGGFSRDFTVLPRRYTQDDPLFGSVLCGSTQPNFCSGCAADFVDRDALIDLFKETCQALRGGCDSEQIESAAAAYGLSADEINAIKSSDDADYTFAIVGAVCAFVAVALVGVWYRRRRSSGEGKGVSINVHVAGNKKRKKKPAPPPRTRGRTQGGPLTPGTPRSPYGQGGLRTPRTPRTPTTARFYGQGARTPTVTSTAKLHEQA
eukprot:g1961.t1